MVKVMQPQVIERCNSGRSYATIVAIVEYGFETTLSLWAYFHPCYSPFSCQLWFKLTYSKLLYSNVKKQNLSFNLTVNFLLYEMVQSLCGINLTSLDFQLHLKQVSTSERPWTAKFELWLVRGIASYSGWLTESLRNCFLIFHCKNMFFMSSEQTVSHIRESKNTVLEFFRRRLLAYLANWRAGGAGEGLNS